MATKTKVLVAANRSSVSLAIRLPEAAGHWSNTSLGYAAAGTAARILVNRELDCALTTYMQNDYSWIVKLELCSDDDSDVETAKSVLEMTAKYLQR